MKYDEYERVMRTQRSNYVSSRYFSNACCRNADVAARRKLVHSVSFLKKYTIPEPVAGGLLVALALLILKKSMGWEVNFDMSLRDPLMLAFFATIGLNANLASLRAGGRVVGVFLIVVVGLLVMQNAIGIGMASLLGLDPLMGLLAGSITLSGGHGTGAAWSKLFIERYGFTNATEVAMACATFGLVLGGLIGGPVARYLVKHSTTPNGIPDDQKFRLRSKSRMWAA